MHCVFPWGKQGNLKKLQIFFQNGCILTASHSVVFVSYGFRIRATFCNLSCGDYGLQTDSAFLSRMLLNY